MGKGKTTTQEKDFTYGDGNVFQKTCFPRGRDLDLYRVMLVCNQNKMLVLQTLINRFPTRKSLAF